MNDLAKKQPARVKQMSDLWQKYGERTNVLPWPGTRRKPPKKSPAKDKK